MLGVDRRREVYDYVRAHRSASVGELAQALAVSLQTVRRDLASLEEGGLVQRVHGGAVVHDRPEPEEIEALNRAGIRQEQKRRIGAAAARLVEPGTTIFLSGGTTTEHVVPFLEHIRGLTVVTNAINIAQALARHPEIEVIVLSGYLRHRELTLLGRLVEEAIGQFNIDRALYGCFGLDPDDGLTGASLEEASTDRAIIAAVDRLTVLADHSKFAQRGPVRMAERSRISTVVTDREAPAEAVRQLREHDVEVVLT